jgi:hypothetical protein
MSVAERLYLPEIRSARTATTVSSPALRSKSDHIPWPGALVLAIATAWVLVGNGLLPGRPAAFSLHASDSHGRVEMHWDPATESVRKADSATLDALDEGTTTRYPVEPKILQWGALAYVRPERDVALTMTLYKNGQPSERASILSIGPVSSAK